MSADHAVSTAAAIPADLPLSKASSWPNSSARSVSRSPTRQSRRSRSFGFIRAHGPSSNARRAARTARSTSAASPWATSVMGAVVAGSKVVKVLPDAAPVHSPPISIERSVEMKSLTRDVNWGSAMAVIHSPSVSMHSRLCDCGHSANERWCPTVRNLYTLPDAEDHPVGRTSLSDRCPVREAGCTACCD